MSFPEVMRGFFPFYYSSSDIEWQVSCTFDVVVTIVGLLLSQNFFTLYKRSIVFSEEE